MSLAVEIDQEEKEPMTFKELVEKNKKTLYDNLEGDLLDLILYDYENDEIEELDQWQVRDRIDHNGGLHEYIDGQVDIYNYDLRKWAVENHEWIEDAISEGLCDGTDYHKSIQAGQFLYYSQEADRELKEIVEELNELIEKELEE